MTNQSQISHHKRGFRWWAGRISMGGLALVLALGVVTWLAGASAKSNLVKQYPAPGQLVDVGGYRMHINCIGQGNPTVILEAGLDDFSVLWELVQPEVAKFARVCAYDRAGYGWSEPSPYPRTTETVVKELHTLLLNAKVEKPYVLVGHSFGGALARLYTHDYPDEVTGMVLVDSAHDDLFARIPTWRKANEQMLGLFRTLALLSSVGILALAPDNIPNRGLPDEALAQYQAILVTTRYFETAIAETESFEKNLTEVRAANITSLGDIPLIVLSREVWEPLPSVSEAENQQAWQAWQAMQSELAELSTNSKQVIAEKSGHNIHLQQPQLLIEAILQIVQVTHV
jgi:pimeloyl-ACP methyl ester carboxylesterase